ncbi:ABC transporter ATP-binding protein [Leptothoe sp. LEGE 181152]|nr:ABC transporter ATP-binding protein [Leptothoe sp. LEGE 181152]
MSHLIQLQNLSKTYGIGDLQVYALKAVDLTINSGDYCTIMGPSGSGKSTMMNMIGCLDRPTQGDYWLDGVKISQLTAKQLAGIRNRKIGFIFQQFHLLHQLTAVENVVLPMVYAGVPAGERESRAIAALQRVGLGDRLGNRPNQLSGGQQQRVAIARAIVNQPKLLLADEPTGALDSQMSQEIMDIFAELNQQGMTLVMVTHDPEVAQRCRRTITFRDGSVLQDSHHQPSRPIPSDLAPGPSNT